MNRTPRLALALLLATAAAGCAGHTDEAVDGGTPATTGAPAPEHAEFARAADRPAMGPAPAAKPAPRRGLASMSDARLRREVLGVKNDGGEAWRLPDEEGSTEEYRADEENPFRHVRTAPLSTFAVDVDTASYAMVRRMLNDGSLPPAGAVRIEEMVNYFPYADAPPTDGRPFAVHLESASCAWSPRHRLVRIGLKGREPDASTRPAANLVFLLDVSGSMNSANKLPLLKRSLQLLAERLAERDRVAIVVYAGSSGLVLPSTPGSERKEVVDALERLQAGGSTNGGAGIRLAYATAKEHFIKGGINRVILATDGDFNVGTTSESDLVDLVKAEAKSGVFLTVLGFGSGNYKDTKLEALADKGNGNYAYIDSLTEGRKVLVEQAGGTLETIAKDVKIQVEFNPARVAGYRLIGYENRLLAAEDFNDDTKDAGEIGAGHTVTALYEVVPAGMDVPGADVDELKYDTPGGEGGASNPELLTVKLRWKEPDGDTSLLREHALVDDGGTWERASDDFRFAAAVACFGMVLRNSAHHNGAGWDTVLELAGDALGDDPQGYRREMLDLVAKARTLGPR